MKIYLILILLLFSGCKWFTGAETPFLSMTTPQIPDGTPIFQKGFKEGCESIIHNRATGFYRDRFQYQYDTSLMDNPEYQFGYSRGWTNCFNYVVAGRHTLGGSADTYIYGGNWGAPIGMGKGNINDTVNYQTGSWTNPFASGNGIDGMFDVLQKGKGGGGTATGPGTAFGGQPFWGTWQDGQIFGQ